MTNIQTTHQYRCDLNRGPCEVTLKMPIMHQDALGDVFRVSVWRKGKVVDLSGLSVRGYLYFASTRQTLPLEGSVTDNCACVTLTSECYAIPGYASLVVQLLDGNIRHTVLKVNMCIDRTGSENVIDPGSIVPTLAELLSQIDAMEQATAKARTAAAAADEARAGIQGDLTALAEDLGYNTYSVIRGKRIQQDADSNGVKFRWEGNVCTVVGTATREAFSNITVMQPLDGSIEPGRKYILTIKSTDVNIGVRMYFCINGNWENVIHFTSTAVVSVPEEAEGIIVRVQPNVGVAINGTIEVDLLNARTNEYLTDSIDELTSKVADVEVELPKRIYAKSAAPYAKDNVLSLSSIREDGYYVIDEGWTVVDAPEGLRVTGLRVENYSVTRQMFVKQTVESVTNPAAYRRYFRVLNSQGVFSRWIDESFDTSAVHVMEGPLLSGDLNDVRESKICLLIDSQTYKNAPAGVESVGFLYTATTGTWTIQIFASFSSAKMYKRVCSIYSNEWREWMEITGGATYETTNEYVTNHYSNTYNVTATPEIKTDTNAYLAARTDGADVTADIAAMLTKSKVCRLGAGDFYVSGIDMPSGTQLIGSGPATRVILKSDVAEGYAIHPWTNCSIKDLTIAGGSTTILEAPAQRHGILFEGNANGNADQIPTRVNIENVYIHGFSGGGITCSNTGYATTACLNAADCYIYNCSAGINIPYWAEFNRFTNVHVSGCWYGAINNGGNNMFVNCGFSSNKMGMLQDNTGNKSPNNSHGSAVGCVFNHSGSNTGYGIKMINCANGFVFDGCQIFYSKILLDECQGVVVSSTNFGHSNCDIEVNGGGAILFSGNVHQGQPAIKVTNNDKTHFVHCYVRATGEAVTN